MKRVGVALSTLIIVGGFGLSIASLDRFPPVHQDEPWIASAAASLAETGTYGTPLFTGFHGAERRAFMFPPALPLIEAAVFRAAGISVTTMRVPGIIAVVAILVLAVVLGMRAGGVWCGVLAAALLIGLAPAGGWGGTSGVPLLDIGRVARYDILVPAFGLGALLCLERAGVQRSRGPLLLAGAFTGVATLSHLYGVFWLIGLSLAIGLRPVPGADRVRAVGWLLAGFVIAMAPAALWVAAGWSDFIGQQQILTDRYHVLDPRFLAANLLREAQRYRPLFTQAEPLGWSLLRPGLWLALGGTLAGLFVLRRRGGAAESPASADAGRGAGDDDRLAFTIAVLLLVQVALFALLVRVKTFSYLISVWPLAALLIARVAVHALTPAAAARDPRQLPRVHVGPGVRRWARGALALLLLAGFVEGALRIRGWLGRASGVTPYATVTQSIAARVPAGAHILGLHQWWLGLRDYRYTSWLLPVWRSDPRYTEPPLALDVAIEAVAPDVVLMDAAMAGWFREISDPRHEDHARYAAWRSWIARRGFRPIGSVPDPAGGAIQIWSNSMQGFR